MKCTNRCIMQFGKCYMALQTLITGTFNPARVSGKASVKERCLKMKD